MSVRNTIQPYIKQFRRSPLWVKIVASVILIYIATPIDLFDILFPWMAFSDDIFLAGLLLRLLYKYGARDGEVPTKPKDLVAQILRSRKTEGIKNIP